ncbi:MAG: hypothetical protein ACR2PL_06570, partial [Dehalococcoidia bacterium]
GLVRAQLGTDTIDRRAFLNPRAPRMVLLAVSDLGLQTLPALRDLLQISGGSLARQAIHVGVDERATVALEQDWEQLGLSAVGIPLVVLPSEFGGGNIVGDLVNYVRGILSADPEMTVELIIPEWTTSTTWWRWLATRSLHHLTGSRLKLAFLNQDRVTVTNHRYILPALSHVK